MIEYRHIKPLLFKLDPEKAHNIGECFLRLANVCPPLFNPWIKNHFVMDDMLTQNIFGREFLNPVGLAAGFDKNATMVRAMQALGFGFSEIGTLTPLSQPGNPKPRMFRHVEEQSVQNAMGFNNKGLHVVEQNLKKVYPFSTPIGVNIGKNKKTSEENAIRDYTRLIQALHTMGDYIVINISSPNTPGLRDLQNEAFIKELFETSKKLTNKPILLKIAPDMELNEAVDLCSFAVKSGADGIIATNTTVDYSLVSKPADIGGISGAVLKEKSFAIFDAIASELYGKTTLISVGGIDSGDEAYRRICAGASLVQVYSALVFHGQTLIRDINDGIIQNLKQDGFEHISQAIGSKR
ncbi:MAG: quinone-dependent dihydroorotate dehydrogenase [Campylobacterota bacterium]|nr:quinone-dependent dihydroorotate dehydrogenase [Campylobacterota bacterium]